MLSRGFGNILYLILLRQCFQISVKNQWKHQGHRLGVLIKFGLISDFLKTHSNISWGSEECSVEVLATYFASDYLGDVFKYRWKINENTKAIDFVS